MEENLPAFPNDLEKLTPARKAEIFRETLDKLIIAMKNVLKKITPLLKRILIIVGVLFIIKTLVDLLPAGGIFSLYQSQENKISIDELKRRFWGGYISWGAFWLISIILSFYITSAVSSKYEEIKPEIDILSKDLKDLNTVTWSLAQDINKTGQLALNYMSTPAAMKYLRQDTPSSTARALPSAPLRTTTQRQFNIPSRATS
jgi:hypothetical protein